MKIELDITDATLQDGKVVDWTNPDELVIVGVDYNVAAEDEDDQPVNPENGLHYYGSEIHFESSQNVASEAADALREQAEELRHTALGLEAAGKTDHARSAQERRVELLRLAGQLDGTIIPLSEVSPKEGDRLYQIERGVILGTAVGRARLALKQGDAAEAEAFLDQAAADSRALLRRHLRFFDTNRLSLPEETTETV